MDIRLMTTDDYNAARALWDGTPGVGLNSVDDSPEGIARYLTRNPSSCFVAIKDAQIVGTIMAGHDGRRGLIYHLTVRSDFRRNGFGKALVSAALDALRADGISKVLLVVMKSNETGNRFWEALGFTERDDLNYRNISLNPLVR